LQEENYQELVADVQKYIAVLENEVQKVLLYGVLDLL
jgi:hypothetical protein